MATRRESWGREQEILVGIDLRDLLRELLDFAGYRFVFQFEPDVQNEGAGSLCNELMDVLLHTKNSPNVTSVASSNSCLEQTSPTQRHIDNKQPLYELLHD